MSRLKSHYERVVRDDILLRGSNLSHINELPSFNKVNLHWSMVKLGISGNHLPAASSALHLITGKTPIMIVSGKSVAQWRIREGDMVSVIVTRRGDDIYHLLETCINVVFPQTRPFVGFSYDLLDHMGICTVPIEQPRLFPHLADHYEAFAPLCSRGGLSITIDTGSTSREIGMSLLTSMQFPIK